MSRMPELVTHRYNPDVGPYHNLCSLPDAEASAIIERLRREYRPTLKSNYLARAVAARNGGWR